MLKRLIKEYLGIPCGRRFRGLPNRREGCNSGVMEDGKLTECPFVFGTSRCVGLMHTCRRQTFDPRSDFSLRKQSRVEENSDIINVSPRTLSLYKHYRP